jgi:hypothetical protein
VEAGRPVSAEAEGVGFWHRERPMMPLVGAGPPVMGSEEFPG